MSQLIEEVFYVRGRYFLLPHGREEHVDVLIAELFHQQALRGVVYLQLPVLQSSVKQLFAYLGHFERLLPQGLPQFGLGPCGHDVVHPVLLRLLVGRGED